MKYRTKSDNQFDCYTYLWGNVDGYYKNRHTDYVKYSDSTFSAIRYSKKHDHNKYWFSIKPTIIEDYKNIGIKSHIFGLVDVGSINLPADLLYDYIKTADNTVSGYQIRIKIRNSTNFHLFTSAYYDKNITQYLKNFQSEFSEYC